MSDRASVAAQQWQQERPDLDPFPMEVLGRLSQLVHVAEKEWITPLFLKSGLQQGEFDVLATLRRSGSPYHLTPTALYKAMMISSGGMTNRIDRLEKAGLIKRQPDPEDRRGTLVCLTSQGKLLIDDLVGKHIENERRILAPLSIPEQQELNRLAAKLLTGLEEQAASGMKPEV